MTIREAINNDRRRARTEDDKARVREAFIQAGRDLFSESDPTKVSLRQIAAAAGYTPAAIYQYFADQRELFAYIREHDMGVAAEKFERAIASTKDPVKRVQRLFYVTVDYWLANMDHFLVLFPAPTHRPAVPTEGSTPFGRSPVVQRILKLYYDAVEEMFDSLARHPLAPRLATDTMLAAVYGTIVFPRMTSTMPWSDTRAMARRLIQSVLAQWVREGNEKPARR